MKRHLPFTIFVLLVLASTATRLFAELEPGFVSLMDGTTFNGWKSSTENTNTWKIEDGAFVTRGNRSHLYYVGDDKPFKNFHLKVDVMTDTNSNGGIYFHTKYQQTDWPRAGFESQVNNTQSDWIKTGSLYGLVNIGLTATADNVWWTQEIIVQNSSITVLINGRRLFEYNEPPGAQPGATYARKLGEGTFALQGHDPKSIVRYKNIRVKRLD